MLQRKSSWGKNLLAFVENLYERTPQINWEISYCNSIIRGEIMSFTLPDDKTATLTIAPVDAAGLPAKIDGAATFASSDAAIATVTVSEDGLSAVLAPATPVVLGTAQITVTVDADTGAGVTTLTGLLDVEVVAGQAVTLAVNAALN